ncbi:MAG: lysine--tRNA ligase [Gammaproteobacteria bacterium]|jgi:lysyl-tRNA synthetase class 2|nr:lysine--tRNA ligase [Gammaproteobacteria bacterium]|tara:strand:+ start:12160 stop:13638 length:1479 start_codon:yes stop_codon:yes gene_type:complete
MEDKNNDSHRLILERRKKLDLLKESGNNYLNDFSGNISCEQIRKISNDKNIIDNEKKKFVVMGRMMSKRIMGKSSFANIKDSSGSIQFYVDKKKFTEDQFKIFKNSDIGDIIYVEGYLFKTKTNELTLFAVDFNLVTKSLRPLPEKFHGLSDQEIKYRKRYLDLICNKGSWDTFNDRFKIIKAVRNYFDNLGFIEVETPMMQKIPGGATAKPFITHHNTLDMDLYMRIAPELYLKRLIVGGFEKIYEINRNFRNEGVSSKHNPEFTMIEFYQTYCNYSDMMNITEDLLRYVVNKVKGVSLINYQGQNLDFGKPFKRITLKESILEFENNLTKDDIDNIDKIKNYCSKENIDITKHSSIGEIQFALFEKIVEPNLLDPTFITEYPIEVSPLARVNNENPLIADRFEFFIMGKEIANGFSELNDPDDQRKRFENQAALKDGGNDEAMYFDEDYIEALEHGMPPTAGEGIGIDRLVMILTDSPSIRDVLLFPLMR